MQYWFLALSGTERNTGKLTLADLSDDEIGEFFFLGLKKVPYVCHSHSNYENSELVFK